MKILDVDQIRQLDQYTILNEPIAPIQLMERASQAFTNWFMAHYDTKTAVKVFCGLGNNGGDGLAIARMLIQAAYNVEVFVVRYAPRESDDFAHNHRRLKLLTNPIYIENGGDIPTLRHSDVVIDAILGSGISRPAEGIVRAVIEAINRAPACVVSVDMASGLYANSATEPGEITITPDHTVTFEMPKLAMMLPGNAKSVGEWHVVDIGLHQRFIDQSPTPYYYTTRDEARLLLRRRERFSNKGTFGHALLLVGSYGKIGAGVLAARACLRSGVGLLTVQVPRCGYGILQTAVPEVMCRPDVHERLLTGPSEVEGPALADYAAVGIGPGIGKAPETARFLREVLTNCRKPVVVDADALNLLAEQRDLMGLLPENSILTPHPKEFERLTQRWQNDYDKLEILRDFAQRKQVIVVLKGAHTAVALPNGDVHFNSTGNPGMSTGGTGDVLTGVLTALLAQGYDPVEAAVLGVFAHGHAGDLAAKQHGEVGLTASDVTDSLQWTW
ncbi:NAD(P)H-hydrate dehydratase [Fibrella aquatilis]|uniref:Bifunctional NAD(P)H-hydrate repair enzyme n=1 Tax=Fibrella aquatilis TaxID=2817059 RepID=A0A939K031_9BACT|nr:NAD(P)H-hydrate dehydratase [Fibrella aquatilis]MBO0932048.1 NAD(P)H-hydrate dehydratase [Fibrella aquatilis]